MRQKLTPSLHRSLCIATILLMSRIPAGISIEIPTEGFLLTMVIGLVLLFTAVVVVTVVQLVGTWQPARRARNVDALARSANLVVPDSTREPLEHAVAARARGALIGSLIALLAAVLFLRPWAHTDEPVGIGTVIVGMAILLAGTTAGAVVGGLLGRRTTHTSPRTARLTTVEYSDLIAPSERMLVKTSAVAGVAFPGLLALAGTLPWVDKDLFATVNVSLLLAAGLFGAALAMSLPWIGRRLVAARAIAGDEPALAWSDALAARTLRDLAHLVGTVGALSAMFAVMSFGLVLPQEWTTAANLWANAGFYVAMAGLIVVAILTTRNHPERHVQRTLWPQFAIDAK